MRRLSIFLVPKRAGSIAILFVCSLVLVGCSSVPNKAQPTFPIVQARELLLSAQAFPPSWQVNSCGVGCDRAERATHAYRTFGRKALPGHVVQQVYVSQDAEAAHAQFAHLRDAEFAPLSPPKRTFAPVPAIPYHSSIADEVAVGCGNDDVEACKAILRYRNYVVQFYFDIDEGENDGLKLGDIEPILKGVDAQITRVFEVIPSATQ